MRRILLLLLVLACLFTPVPWTSADLLDLGGDLRSITGTLNVENNIRLSSTANLQLGKVTVVLCPTCQILYESNTVIEGIGDQTIIQVTGNLPAIAPATPGPKPRVGVRHLAIDGGSQPGSVGILWQNVHWGAIDDVKVQNADTLIQIDSGDSSTLYNRVLSPRLRFGKVGISFTGGGATNANIFIGGQIANVDTAVQVSGQANKFTGMAVETFTTVGFDLLSGAADTLIEGTHFENQGATNANAIRIQPGVVRTTTIGNGFLGVNSGIANMSPANQLISLDHQAPFLPFVATPTPGLPPTTAPEFATPKFSVGDIVQRLDGMQGMIQGVYGRPPGMQDYFIYWNDGSKGIELEVNLILIHDNP